jgi:hypothetical protein
MSIDALDIFAFFVFGVLIAAAMVIIIGLGSLPGAIAWKRGHPQAAAVTVASWLGLALGGILWPLALIWAFWKPSAPAAAGAPASPAPQPRNGPEAATSASAMEARMDALEVTVRRLQAQKEERT